MNEQEIITRAKGHLRLGNYAKARLLLNEVATNSVAKKLLVRLDKFEARKRANLGQGDGMTASVAKPKNSPHHIPRPALFIIVGSMFFWASVYVLSAISNPDTQNLLFVIVGIFTVFALIFVLYYLFWRFYWWMLAFAWLLSVFFLVIALTSGANLSLS